MDGLNKAETFYYQYHKDHVKDAIENKLDGATMFGYCFGYISYWKFENGLLYHNSYILRDQWIKTKFTSLKQAYNDGIVQIYDLIGLEKLNAN